MVEEILEHTRSRNGTHPRILVVDADPELGEALRRLLQRQTGGVATWVGSAEDAMRTTQLRRYDLMVLAHRLPGIDGIVLGAMLMQLNPDADAVLLLDDDHPRLIQLGQETGFKGVVTKKGPWPGEVSSESSLAAAGTPSTR